MPTKITVTIEDELGDLSVAANGWKKQLTYTSWNGIPSLIYVRGAWIINQ